MIHRSTFSGEGARALRIAVHLLGSCVIVLMASRCAIAQVAQAACPLDFAHARDYRPGKYIQESTYGSHRALLKLVEDAHFSPVVETLQRGISNGRPGGDIGYTLTIYPNHHRALLSLVSLSELEKKNQPSGMAYPVDCWFQRALTFRPDDGIVRMIYAQYLIKSSRNADAEQQLGVVASQADDNAYTHFNVGMLYFSTKNFEKSQFHAHKAIELGLTNATLKNKLSLVGQWSELPGIPPGEPDEKEK
jgi:hypothetical protein